MMQETHGIPSLQTPSIAQWNWPHNEILDRKSSGIHVIQQVPQVSTSVLQNPVGWTESNGNSSLFGQVRT